MFRGGLPVFRPHRFVQELLKRHMRLRLTPTIASKVFANTTILLVLMTAITLMSREVRRPVFSVEQTYLPTYANLARAQIRSLEQSFLGTFVLTEMWRVTPSAPASPGRSPW